MSGTLCAARALLKHRPVPLWAALGALAPWVYWLIVQRHVREWGAQPGDAARVLPGDRYVPDAAYRATRAVTIHAPPRAIWPWLLQIGQDRGGYYSYDWLENLAGLDIHSADRIVPAWQTLAAGDLVAAAPGEVGFRVAQIDPERVLVYSEGNAYSWVLALEPVTSQTTRLIARFQATGKPRALMGLLYTALLELPHFIMERKMLLGIKARAERTHLHQRAM
jgi:hypothetical protein